jgi:PAS domain S-box-containing protein
MYADLIQNTSLMVALTALYSLLSRLNMHGETRGKILSGILFGGVAIVGMQLPFHYAPGIIYDGRSIILAMAGLFGGETTAIVSIVLAGAFRAHMGGAGMWAGLGTIIGCAGIGLILRRAYGNRPDRMGAFPLYGFGISVHLLMLACQLLIRPWPYGLVVINRIWLPILLIFPIITVLMGLFLGTEERRIQAEISLRENEALLSRSQSVGHVGSWEYDVDNNRLSWSDEVYRIFGLRPREFTATYEAFLDFVHPDDRMSVDAAYKESINEGSDGYQIEHRIIRRDNDEVHVVDEKCEHLKDASGRIVRSIGMVQEITERKRAVEELQILSSRNEAILAAVPDIIMEVNNDKVYTWANKAGLYFFGYDVLGKEAAFYFEGEQKTYDIVDPMFAGSEDTVYVESWQRRRDGEKRLLAWWCRILKDRNGIVTGALSTGHDITEKKTAEEEIRELNRTLELRVQQRTAQLEEANKELEDFVYSVSHDLRAPLRSISGFAQIIDRRHKASLNTEGQHYFDNIVTASRQMGDLIDDLLNFSRLGNRAIKSETVSLENVFKIAVTTLSDQIEKTGARVQLPKQMTDIWGDLTLATHVFINLFENALKFGKPDESPIIDVGVDVEDQYVTISVADNGIGIEPEYHEKIFNIFQRLHSNEAYSGTGIGLAGVKKAVQIMKGRVCVESKPDTGSIFKIKLLKAPTA